MFTASYPASFLPEGHGRAFTSASSICPKLLPEAGDIEDTLSSLPTVWRKPLPAASPPVTRFPRHRSGS